MFSITDELRLPYPVITRCCFQLMLFSDSVKFSSSHLLQVKETVPVHLVATLIQATSDCLHTCLMALPEDFHSLVTKVHHPDTPPTQIAHIASCQLPSSQPRWMSSEGSLLKLCKEAVSRRPLSVLHSTLMMVAICYCRTVTSGLGISATPTGLFTQQLSACMDTMDIIGLVTDRLMT